MRAKGGVDDPLAMLGGVEPAAGVAEEGMGRGEDDGCDGADDGDTLGDDRGGACDVEGEDLCWRTAGGVGETPEGALSSQRMFWTLSWTCWTLRLLMSEHFSSCVNVESARRRPVCEFDDEQAQEACSPRCESCSPRCESCSPPCESQTGVSSQAASSFPRRPFSRQRRSPKKGAFFSSSFLSSCSSSQLRKGCVGASLPFEPWDNELWDNELWDNIQLSDNIQISDNIHSTDSSDDQPSDPSPLGRYDNPTTSPYKDLVPDHTSSLVDSTTIAPLTQSHTMLASHSTATPPGYPHYRPQSDAANSGNSAHPPRNSLKLAYSRPQRPLLSSIPSETTHVPLPSPSSSSTLSSSSDNVPLAKSIPTALTAQKSIRKQVREERDQRRRQRAEIRASRAQEDTENPRGRLTTPRPAPLGLHSTPAHDTGSFLASVSRSRSAGKATSITASAFRAAERAKTRTLPVPGRTTPPSSADDLTTKLQDVLRAPVSGRSGNASGISNTNPTIALPAESTTRTLRPQRSFHSPSTCPAAAALDDARSIPRSHHYQQQQQYPLHRAKSHGRLHAGDHSTMKPPLIEDVKGVPPVPKIERLEKKPSVRSAAASTRPSIESSHGGSSSVERRPSSKRPSTADRDRAGQQQRPPVPPIPPAVAAEIMAKPAQVTQQRVFIGDLQSYNVVEIDDLTTAGDLIEMLQGRGSLKEWIGKGEWMIWEMVHDLGVGTWFSFLSLSRCWALT